MKALTGLLSVALLFAGALDSAQGGATGGQRRWTRAVKGNSIVAYKIEFQESRGKDDLAEFVVVGDGSTDVDIHVFDANGRPIVKDVLLTDIARVTWVVPRTQTYTIRVVNLGAGDNKCLMGHS